MQKGKNFMKDLVCTLQTAKRMAELGIKIDTVFYWVKAKAPIGIWVWTIIERYRDSTIFADGKADRDSLLPAPTAEEAGKILPKQVDYDVSENGYRSLNLTVGKTIINDGYYVMYSDPHPANKVPVYSQHADTLSESLCLMACWLKEKGMI